MDTKELKTQLKKIWQKLYPEAEMFFLENFVNELVLNKERLKYPPNEPLWYKKTVVYNLYVDLFNNTFEGLIEKLDYLKDLGTGCIWLLPVLDSPLKDQGYDVRDFGKIRNDLFSDPQKSEEIFDKFISEAHKRDIKIIFDVPLNHTSDEHPHFRDAVKNLQKSPFWNYYFWSKQPENEFNPPVIFKDFYDTNWHKLEGTEWYYFHKFYHHQPDLNYKNPEVLLEMARVFVYWTVKGIDGFRLDAIPHLWKEKGTDCVNLPQVHEIVKFLRYSVDFVRPNTLFVAEATFKKPDIEKYFDTEEEKECNAAYHFPLTLDLFKAFATEDKQPILDGISKKEAENRQPYQWFLFLRGHDDLNFSLLSEKDKKFMFEYYCKRPEWSFSKGDAVTARLADLLDNDRRRILLAYSVLLTLPFTPINFYGDEYGKRTDYEFHKLMLQKTGQDDRRFLARGYMEWEKTGNDLFKEIKKMLNLRSKNTFLGTGKMLPVNLKTEKPENSKHIFAYYRRDNKNNWLIINNLSSKKIFVKLPEKPAKEILNKNFSAKNDMLEIDGYDFYWFEI